MKKPTPVFDRPCPMLRMTRELVQRDKRTLIELHDASGLPFYWLRKFRQGVIVAPSINRVQFLYDFLIKTRNAK